MVDLQCSVNFCHTANMIIFIIRKSSFKLKHKWKSSLLRSSKCDTKSVLEYSSNIHSFFFFFFKYPFLVINPQTLALQRQRDLDHLQWKTDFLSFLLSLFFLFPIPQHMEFPDQGSYQSHSFNLHQSCGYARSLIHCADLEIECLLHVRAPEMLPNLLCHSSNS